MLDLNIKPIDLWIVPKLKMVKIDLMSLGWKEAQIWTLFSIWFNACPAVCNKKIKIQLIIFNKTFEWGVSTQLNTVQKL